MPIDKPLLDLVIGQHPARKMGFDALYDGLLENVETGAIIRRKNADLELFNYSQETMFEKNWNIFTLISRGLILLPAEKKVIATPFPKFFNYGEVEIWDSEQHDGDILALEKLDGSLGIVYHHNGEWHCATRGAFDSEQAMWAKTWLNNNIDTNVLETDHTYLFEIIYPENRIVVSYDYEGMVLLSAYCNNGFEYDTHRLHDLTEQINVKKAILYPYENINSFVKQANEIDKDNEGWVIRFPNGHRVKIKGDAYCRLHRLITNVTPLGVWNLLLEMDDIEAIRRDLPEEHLKDFDAIKEILETKIDDLLAHVAAAVEARKDLSDKDVGLSKAKGVWPDGQEFTEEEAKFFFMARKFGLNKDVLDKGGRPRLQVFKHIKPKANILEGYEPSKAVNRFQNEAAQN